MRQLGEIQRETAAEKKTDDQRFFNKAICLTDFKEPAKRASGTQNAYVSLLGKILSSTLKASKVFFVEAGPKVLQSKHAAGNLLML